MAYSAPYRTPALTHKSISGYGFDDYSRYPYGDPIRGEYDQGYMGAPYNDSMYQAGYDNYGAMMPSRSQYGGYEDYGYDRNYYSDMDYQPYGAMTPRRRRSSSYSRQYSTSGMSGGNALYDMYHSRGSGVIKFRVKGAFRSGVTISDVVSGVRLAGEDGLRWHELNADGRGRIYLKIRWNGYNSLTYEIPVDEYGGRARLSTLARRVGRACIHFIQSNRIPISLDRVKLYYLEEAYPGTWQPSLTIQ